MKKTLIVLAVLIGLTTLFVGSWALSWVGEAATVAREEFGPRELLRKYSQFKDTHAALAAQKSSIDTMQAGIDAFKADYKDVPKKDWPRDERQAYNMNRSAVSGMKLRFNSVAAQYNADMAKFNYRFCNVGTLPEGASEPLPREYVTYIVN